MRRLGVMAVHLKVTQYVSYLTIDGENFDLSISIKEICLLETTRWARFPRPAWVGRIRRAGSRSPAKLRLDCSDVRTWNTRTRDSGL
jgi:hypothetical protein